MHTVDGAKQMSVFMGSTFGEGSSTKDEAQAPAKVEGEQPRPEPDLNKFVRLERHQKVSEENKALRKELDELKAAHAQEIAELEKEITDLEADLEAELEKWRQDLINRVAAVEQRLNAMQAPGGWFSRSK